MIATIKSNRIIYDLSEKMQLVVNLHERYALL